MAKTDNFQDFVIDIANALRIKHNTSEQIHPNDFYKKILSIRHYVDCNSLDHIELVYNVSTTSSATKLYQSLNNVTEMYVDGVKVDVANSYKFSSTGRHTVKLYGVTAIGNRAFAQSTSLISVALSNKVRSIGEYAFYLCNSVEKISMSDTVTSVGNFAFSYAHGLETIELSKNLSSLGSSCFYECSSLKEIISRATYAPEVDVYTFQYISKGGVLKVPRGADYSSYDLWLSLYNWTVEEVDINDYIYEEPDVTIESVQQFVTHIANAIRIAGNLGTTKINPQDFYNRIISL